MACGLLSQRLLHPHLRKVFYNQQGKNRNIKSQQNRRQQRRARQQQEQLSPLHARLEQLYQQFPVYPREFFFNSTPLTKEYVDEKENFFTADCQEYLSSVIVTTYLALTMTLTTLPLFTAISNLIPLFLITLRILIIFNVLRPSLRCRTPTAASHVSHEYDHKKKATHRSSPFTKPLSQTQITRPAEGVILQSYKFKKLPQRPHDVTPNDFDVLSLAVTSCIKINFP